MTDSKRLQESDFLLSRALSSSAIQPYTLNLDEVEKSAIVKERFRCTTETFQSRRRTGADPCFAIPKNGKIWTLTFQLSRSPVNKQNRVFNCDSFLQNSLSCLPFFILRLFQGELGIRPDLSCLSVIQVKMLIEYLDKSHQNIASFLDSIQFDDLSYSFKTQRRPCVSSPSPGTQSSVAETAQREREKDSEFLFFKNIVMHVGIGLLVIFKEDGKSKSSTARPGNC